MRKEATAYHEAGHAVVGFLCGFLVESATIRANGDAVGQVAVKPRGKLDLDSASPAMRIKAEKWIIMTLAGDIAQRRYAPRSSRQWQTTSDRQTAAVMALSICGSGESATAYVAWLSIVTRDMVQGRWPMIERVAQALLERETISGDELRSVLTGRPAPTNLI